MSAAGAPDEAEAVDEALEDVMGGGAGAFLI